MKPGLEFRRRQASSAFPGPALLVDPPRHICPDRRGGGPSSPKSSPCSSSLDRRPHASSRLPPRMTHLPCCSLLSPGACGPNYSLPRQGGAQQGLCFVESPHFLSGTVLP